ncbi:MAG: aminotransferase class IV [Saccharofermentanales bacterium]
MRYPIIDDLAGSFVIDRGRLLAVDSADAADLFRPTGRTMFYEVIRVVRGIPLFWEDHLIRLQRSVQEPATIPEGLYEDSLNLIAANGLETANLRLVLLENQAVIHLTPSNYPTSDLFSQGVATGILNWERPNPNIKLIDAGYKAAIAARYAEPGPFGGYYELLLANSDGYLTEGSRSNLFFIRGDQVLTAPDDCILKGITRKHILAAVALSGGALLTEMLTLDAVRQGYCDAAFLSSSPFDILPIRAIEDLKLSSAGNPLLHRINAAYRAIVDRYVEEKLQPGRL